MSKCVADNIITKYTFKELHIHGPPVDDVLVFAAALSSGVLRVILVGLRTVRVVMTKNEIFNCSRRWGCKRHKS